MTDPFRLDEARIAEDALFDGIHVLRTNTRLTPLQAMLRYRELIIARHGTWPVSDTKLAGGIRP